MNASNKNQFVPFSEQHKFSQIDFINDEENGDVNYEVTIQNEDENYVIVYGRINNLNQFKENSKAVGLLKTVLNIYKETGNQFYDNFSNTSIFLNIDIENDNITSISFSFDLDLLNKNKLTEEKLSNLIEILVK